jgi:hypothetical protein
MADRLVLDDTGIIGAAFQGFELGRNGTGQEYGQAFGQLGTRLQRQWWFDVFGERLPPVGSKRWRTQLATLNIPPPDRGPVVLLEDSSTLLLEDEGALRLADS